MRKNRALAPQSDCSILAVDDDPIMTLSLQSYFQAAGYHVDVENDPVDAIQRVREGHYDILLLDFLMMPISGDQVRVTTCPSGMVSVERRTSCAWLRAA